MNWLMVSHVIEHVEAAGMPLNVAILTPGGIATGNRADVAFTATAPLRLPTLVAIGRAADARRLDWTTAPNLAAALPDDDAWPVAAASLGIPLEAHTTASPATLALLLSNVLRGEACSSLACQHLLDLMATDVDDQRIGLLEDALPTGLCMTSFWPTEQGPVIVVGVIRSAPDLATARQMLRGVAQGALHDHLTAGDAAGRGQVGCPYLAGTLEAPRP